MGNIITTLLILFALVALTGFAQSPIQDELSNSEPTAAESPKPEKKPAKKTVKPSKKKAPKKVK